MADASLLIERRPRELTKTALARELGARKAAALRAVDRLVAGGYAATTRGDRGRAVYHCVKPFRDPLPGQCDGRNRSARLDLEAGTVRPLARPHGSPPSDDVYRRIGIWRRAR
jgi:hypothetical protein